MAESFAVDRVSLWAGWSIKLPPSNCATNEDGSWSAWGEDWAVDVHIIEFQPQNIVPMDSVSQVLADGGSRISGPGWIGAIQILSEVDDGRDVFRAAGSLAAAGSIMSCWVSYLRKDQEAFSRALISSVDRSDEA